MRAMSLDTSGKDEEDNEMNSLKQRLDMTNNLVLILSKQLDELRDSVQNLRYDYEPLTIFQKAYKNFYYLKGCRKT